MSFLRLGYKRLSSVSMAFSLALNFLLGWRGPFGKELRATYDQHLVGTESFSPTALEKLSPGNNHVSDLGIHLFLVKALSETLDPAP